MLTLEGKLVWTCMFPKKLPKVFHDKSKNLHAYILSDTAKIYEILSSNKEYFDKHCLEFNKIWLETSF